MFEKIGGIRFWVESLRPFGKVIGHLHYFTVSGHVDMIISPYHYAVMTDRRELVSFQNFVSAYRYAVEVAKDRSPDFDGDSRIFYQF